MPLLPRNPGGQGGGIEEAPLDGKQYGRQNAKWTPIEKSYTLLYYRGPFATPDELKTAHPTDIPGAYAIVSSTNSIWIWNHNKWEDTGTTQTQAGILDAPKDGKTYGRKDGNWEVVGGGTISEDEVVNILKNTQHNILKSIQGGKVENGQVTEAYHLTKEQWEGLPIRPFVMSPANNATNINQVPQIVGSSYAHPQDTLMYMKHIQIAKTSDFAAPVFDKEEISRNVTFQVPLKSDSSPYLEENTLYYVRVRYRDRRMRWSHWSAPSRFTTMKTFPMNVIAMPEMIIPADGGEASAFNPLLAMSTPKIVGGVGEFDQADWQISTDSTFATTIYDAQGTNDLVTHIPHDVNLSVVQASDFYARGRQRMKNGEYSPWAHPVRFGLSPEFDEPIFGLRRVLSRKYNTITIYNIDEAGNAIYIPKRYFDKHPLYQFARQDVTLGQQPDGSSVVSEMCFVPPCWTKHNIYNNPDGDMTIDLWFSATPREGDGWRLDPAFTRSPNGFLLGRRFSKKQTVQHASGNLPVYVSAAPEWGGDITMPPLANLNVINSGNSYGDWHFETFYERRLLLDLAAAETLNLHPGYNAENGSRFLWRGIYVFGNAISGSYGVKFLIGDDRHKKVRLMLPVLSGAFREFDVDYTAKNNNRNGTEILSGDADSFGLDLTLFGIVSSDSTAQSPFGLNGLDMFAPGANQETVDYLALYNQEKLGLFGLVHGGYWGANPNYLRIRVSKWLS